MRFALPKNRTAPLIIFAISGVIVLLTLGSYHINQMVQYSYNIQFENNNSFSNNLAILLKQGINNNYQELQATAMQIASRENLGDEAIAEAVKLLNEDNKYVDITVLDRNGIGYNSFGELVDLSNEDYVVNALLGYGNISDKLIFKKENTPVITYASPIIKDEKCIGVLTASQRAEIKDLAIIGSKMEEGCIIYVINKNNEPIAYNKAEDISSFNYESITSNDSLNVNLMSNSLTINIINFLFEKPVEPIYIWNKVPIGVNNWSVLVGNRYTIDTTTSSILNLTKLMWVVVIATIIVMSLLMITTRVSSNRKVVDTLYLDPVTGGDNWYKFRINANKIIGSKQFNKRSYALINFDINRFKIINDAYGYQKGDEVLRNIYNVIKRWVSAGELVTRYAADQFYVLMSFTDQDELTQRIMDLSERIRQLRYAKTARIFYGVYFITETNDSIDRMGEFAQVAKNNIKGNAEGIISFFDDNARLKLLEEEEIERSMSDALKNNEFLVYLQPKYTAREKTISGAEALVRWQSDNGMPFSPSKFIPLFEKNGFITELDYYMLRKVCQLIKRWLDKGYTPLPISVNISRLHFANAHLAEIITDIVDSYEVPHQFIELELTESAFLQNKQLLIDTVVSLREQGFLVSMDDFGAGYSSLNSLKDLPLDTVKLDGELFRLTDEVERGLCVIRNTITMAKDLHMKVVAECIETREQVEFLCMVGCDVIQGYYFAKPMPADKFEERYLSS